MNPSGFYVDPWLGYTLKRKLANQGNPLTQKQGGPKKNKISDLDKEHKKSFINQ